MADDQTEGVSLALAAAACGALGAGGEPHAARMYEQMRPYAGTAVVIRAPAAACWGRPTTTSGCSPRPSATSPWPRCTSRRRSAWPAAWSSPPFVAAAEVELARTLRQRRRDGDEERVAILLRNAEESALRLGLHRLAQMAAAPG